MYERVLICSDCIHSKLVPDGYTSDKYICTRDGYHVDPVDGSRVLNKKRNCSDERASFGTGACSPDATFFVAKPVGSKRSWIDKLRGLFW